jgi:hypothetical protein
VEWDVGNGGRREQPRLATRRSDRLRWCLGRRGLESGGAAHATGRADQARSLDGERTAAGEIWLAAGNEARRAEERGAEGRG